MASTYLKNDFSLDFSFCARFQLSLIMYKVFGININTSDISVLYLFFRLISLLTRKRLINGEIIANHVQMIITERKKIRAAPEASRTNRPPGKYCWTYNSNNTSQIIIITRNLVFFLPDRNLSLNSCIKKRCYSELH